MTPYQYRKSYCGDKTILRPSYLHNGIFHGKTSLYWLGALYVLLTWRIDYCRKEKQQKGLLGKYPLVNATLMSNRYSKYNYIWKSLKKRIAPKYFLFLLCVHGSLIHDHDQWAKSSTNIFQSYSPRLFSSLSTRGVDYNDSAVCVNINNKHARTCIDTLRPRQHDRHFSRRHFQMHFLLWNLWISMKISLKVVPKGPFDNILLLVQMMARHRTSDMHDVDLLRMMWWTP